MTTAQTTAGTAADLLDRIRQMREAGCTVHQVVKVHGKKARDIIRDHDIPLRRERPTMPGEVWRPVVGFEDRYEVSDWGRVFSVWNPQYPRSGVLMKPTILVAGGYPAVTVWRDRESRTRKVHQLVVEAFIGARPFPEAHVRHLDGNPMNNRLENLRYGTPSENSYDKRGHGTDHNVSKTHCPRNHPYDAANTYIRPSGGRTCRACKRGRWQRDASAINAARRQARAEGRAA